MKFQKGHKFSKGGTKGNKGGRPSKVKLEARRLAADMLKKFLEDSLRSVAEAYLSAADGRRHGNHRRKLDNTTNRHLIDKFLGQAPRTFTIDMQETVESFFDKVMGEGGGDKGEGG